DQMMRELMMRDERLEAAMRQLAMHLSDLLPLDELIQRYPFRGDEEVSLQEAMRLMEELQELDELEREGRGIRSLEELEHMDADGWARRPGEDPRGARGPGRDLSKRGEGAGYLERGGEGLKRPPRAIKKLGNKPPPAFSPRLKRD